MPQRFDIMSILQKAFKTPVLNAHAYNYIKSRLERSLIKCIKNDHNIQDMGAENLYHFIQLINFTRRVCFSPIDEMVEMLQ